ncbi:hypothetical protein [Myxococcus landrumensis]|uniref:Lipoprotein n=1 Tax=Myxococcus landrumensis TaxID=2813577 RepID=A0ABX7N5J8_9BACT|nr:hypothetical protein [Myxococcus landrumus]QSQ12940.1 hypothetical protein JY572_32025 [Myxococcus landrumus]
MASCIHSGTLLFAMLALCSAGCRCGDNSNVGGARQGFRAQDAEVDFGRALEGTSTRRQVTVLATGRASVTVTVASGSPFTVVAPEVSVPGGGTATVDVDYLAGVGPVEGTLTLAGPGGTTSVRLKGLGVRPLTCTPSSPCHESRFDLASGTCLEQPLADGVSCVPLSRCQVNGRCESGACVGAPRSCDDDNPCTVDACSPSLGCVTSPVVCPVPRNPCKVGVCDRDLGCGEEDARDFSTCGPVNCKKARLCFDGSCKEMTPPNGIVCAPATACQGEGTCQGGECEKPDAGDLVATFSQELGGEPVGAPALLVQEGGLFTSVCGGDAGCRLVSFTQQGLLRYESAYPDGGPRTLLAASDAGVVVLAASGLESYAARGLGERQWEAPWEALGAPADAGPWVGHLGAGHVALTEAGDVVAQVAWAHVLDGGSDADGGTAAAAPVPEGARWVWLSGREDAGSLVHAGPIEPWRGDARLVLDTAGTPIRYTVDGRLERADVDPDGGSGLHLTSLREDGGDSLGSASLAASGGTLLVGARAFVSKDGGAQVDVDWEEGTRTLTPHSEPALLSATGTPAYLFAQSCARVDGLPCAPEEERTVLRAVDPRTGRAVWEVDVLPFESLPGTLYDAALMQGDSVGVLADAWLPEGRQVWLQLFAQGERRGMCPLPGRPTRLAGAAFFEGRLVVVLEREGVWRLESYGLGPGLQVETRGWPQRHARPDGARREAP